MGSRTKILGLLYIYIYIYIYIGLVLELLVVRLDHRCMHAYIPQTVLALEGVLTRISFFLSNFFFFLSVFLNILAEPSASSCSSSSCAQIKQKTFKIFKQYSAKKP